jgi:hypothetical protein
VSSSGDKKLTACTPYPLASPTYSFLARAEDQEGSGCTFLLQAPRSLNCSRSVVLAHFCVFLGESGEAEKNTAGSRRTVTLNFVNALRSRR